MKPLLSGYVSKQRIRAIMPFVSGNVLDIGCGLTTLPDALASDQSYVGVDVHPRILDCCISRYPHHTFVRCNLNVESIELGNRRFKTAVMAAVIEHLQFPERILREVHPLLAPDGQLVITTPSPLGDILHRFGSRLGLFYTESVVGHVKVFGQRRLINTVIECGYAVTLFRSFLAGTNQLVVCRPARPQ
jgi:2-polyprenyl-3-methyl-5-hydroxy-6-metoxy-1,4-benzoquinol methylase